MGARAVKCQNCGLLLHELNGPIAHAHEHMCVGAVLYHHKHHPNTDYQPTYAMSPRVAALFCYALGYRNLFLGERPSAGHEEYGISPDHFAMWEEDSPENRYDWLERDEALIPYARDLHGEPRYFIYAYPRRAERERAKAIHDAWDIEL